VLGEGNVVLIISEGYFGEDHSAFYDLFRVVNGKISEHGHLIERLITEENWKNNDGKFYLRYHIDPIVTM
jgi:predicted SnoaL-like aldol condensation-catalyzing enzyme